MKVTLNETAFFVALQARLAAAQLPQLNLGQVEVMRNLLYDGLDLKIEPHGVDVECGTFVVRTVNGKGEPLQEHEPALSNNFILPGFPLETNVMKVALAFDARICEPVAVELTIMPFTLDFPMLKSKEASCG